MATVHLVANAPSTQLSRLIEDYLSHCRARGLSPKTDIAYVSALQRVLLPWCEQQRIERVDQLDTRAMDRLSADLLTRISTRGKPLSRDSVHTYTRGVRQFLTWAKSEGESVVAKPQLPKLGKRHRDVLSITELNSLETAMPTERDKLIVRLFADCGLREGEVARLRVEDIMRPENRGQLHVRGKGRRERRVPVVPRLLRRLERFVEDRSPASSNQIFLGLRRAPSGDYEPLTESGIRQMIRDAGIRAGLSRSVNPHLLRHSWITEMLRQNMDPLQLSIIAGASLQVIQDHYEHLTHEDAYASMIKALTARDNTRRPLA